MSMFYEHDLERREVEELHRLAMDAHREAQYATMERLLKQAAATAENLHNLLLLIKEQYWLADARRMQSKHAQALSTYTWLIGLATDPTQSQQVRDEDSLRYLANAFMDFVESGKLLELPVEQLLRVVADGLDWLERIGQSNWMGGLRLQRGLLFKKQQRWQEARQEMEVALALRRRYTETPGYCLSSFLLQLADLLCEEEVGAYTESIALAEEVLAAPDNNYYDRWWAYRTLAYAYLGLHEYEDAMQAAQQSTTLAHSIESSSTIVNTYQALGKIYRATERLTDATAAAAQQWYWARKNGRVDVLYEMLRDCTQVRLLQVREACGLPLEHEILAEALPAQANRKLAWRWLASARRLIQRTRPFASQLDQAQGNHSSQDALDTLVRQAEQLAVLLAKEEAT